MIKYNFTPTKKDEGKPIRKVDKSLANWTAPTQINKENVQNEAIPGMSASRTMGLSKQIGKDERLYKMKVFYERGIRDIEEFIVELGVSASTVKKYAKELNLELNV